MASIGAAACMLALTVAGRVDKNMGNGHEEIFIPTRLEKPTSVDPLDADRHENLPFARMVYATPIEVSPENTLVSQILSSFTFEPEKNLIHWTVRNGLTFSDGTPITVEDVAFSVARMAYTRPNFPVLEAIKGLKSWRDKSKALESLPVGIRVNKKVIQIELTHHVHNPLFRFTLELFSIIPKKCVNLTSNQIECSNVPTSGNYIVTSLDDQSIDFQLIKSPRNAHGIEAPEKIKFKYLTSAMISAAPEGAVAMGSEYSLRTNKTSKDTLSKFKLKWAPAANYVAMIISPKVIPFDNWKCRALFADALRTRMIKETGPEGIEPSIFPKIIPGYLPPKEMAFSLTEKDRNDCLNYMRNNPLPWARLPIEYNYFIDGLIERTAKDLDIPLGQPTVIDDDSEWIRDLNGGKIAFYPFMSGFWALDPVGDIRMLFTPNLHEDLRLVWQEPQLQSLLKELGLTSEGEGVRSKMEEINRYLNSQAVFNPLIHFRNAYLSKKQEALESVPLAVQQPYPWQLFSSR